MKFHTVIYLSKNKVGKKNSTKKNMRGICSVNVSIILNSVKRVEAGEV